MQQSIIATMIKFLYIPFFLLFVSTTFGQSPCEYVTNVSDSLGVYKETPEQLMYERNFGGTKSNIYFSLAQNDEMPLLNVQFINQSKDFIKVKCLDKNSRMFITLDNGKIITLMHIDLENCGSNVRDNNKNNRAMTGIFMFVKGSMEDLKRSPILTIRIRYAAESEDLIIKESFVAEIDGKKYAPSSYFQRNLRCIE